MGVLRYVETERQVWKHAELEDFERQLVALSEKDGVRKLFTWHRRNKKKKDFLTSFFGRPDVKNERFVEAKRTFSNHTKWKLQKSHVFFEPDD